MCLATTLFLSWFTFLLGAIWLSCYSLKWLNVQGKGPTFGSGVHRRVSIGILSLEKHETWKSSHKSGQEAGRSRTGEAYITLPQIDYCLWEAGPLWGEELGNWKTCAHKHTDIHSVGDIYSRVKSGWDWHHHNDTGPTTEGTKEPVCMLMRVCKCVCPFLLKILRLLYWWKLLTVSTSGGRMGMNEGKKKKKLEWCGQECRFMHVLSQPYCFIRASYKLTERSFYHPFTGETKREERKLKTPPCTAIRNSEPSQVRVSLVIKGCMRRGAHMGMCYFFFT